MPSQTSGAETQRLHVRAYVLVAISFCYSLSAALLNRTMQSEFISQVARWSLSLVWAHSREDQESGGHLSKHTPGPVLKNQAEQQRLIIEKSKHTSGPWEVGIIEGLDVFGPEGLKLATLCGHHKTKANARLIAAAPELLEALECLLSEFDRSDFDALANVRNAHALLARLKPTSSGGAAE